MSLYTYRAIQNDPATYDNFTEFIPERWAKHPYGFKDGVEISEGLRKTYGFGAGRRICPRMHLAESSLVRRGSLVSTTTCLESLSLQNNVSDLVA